MPQRLPPSSVSRTPRRKKRADSDLPQWQPDQLFLGWSGALPTQSSVGFHAAASVLAECEDPGDPLLYSGDGHLMTVAPTGAGKGVGVIVPNLLTYPGSVIAIDIKGELAQVTARRRREMGQHVVVLDPFGLVSDRNDGLNPFDLFDLPNGDPESDAEMLAAQFGADHSFSTDRYWDDTGRGLMAGLIAHVATTFPIEERNPTGLRKLLYHDDLDYTLASWLDKKEVKNPLARDEFVSYLSAPADKTRPCIRSTACTYVKCLGSEPVARSLEKSTFSLKALMAGEPVTIYLVLPPEKLESHKAVLRAWVVTLLTAVLRRAHIPEMRTLFLVDEAAQLGTMPLLKTAITLLRGYGLQVWSFWQDIGQIRTLYPDDWTTMVANASALQVFGVPRHGGARGAWQEVLGEDTRELIHLQAGEMMVSFADSGVSRHRRGNYLNDVLFEGLFDPNKRFERPQRGEGRSA
jgi:type IV secretion system protein VirD4